MSALWALFAALNAAFAVDSFLDGQAALGTFNAVVAVYLFACAIND